MFAPGNEGLNLIVVTILVKRLGGSVKINQADIDDIAYNRLEETGDPDGSIRLKFLEKGKQS